MSVNTGVEVICPNCRQRCLFGATNPWRPFCSERCRGMDLGAWANEDYRVPAKGPGASFESGDAPADPASR